MKKSLVFILALIILISFTAKANLVETITKIKPSVVGVGVYNPLNSPRASLQGTGFVIMQGQHVATNYHVVSNSLDENANEKRVIFAGIGNKPEIYFVDIVSSDPVHDIAILKIISGKLPAVKLSNTEFKPDGTQVAFTGFPIGAVLGLYPVTHRGIISAKTPVVTPSSNSNQLTIAALKRLRNPFYTYQLDATAYPGNSGSAVYLHDTGEVIAIVNKVFVKETKESVLSDPSAITYAIPIKYLNELIEKL